MPRGIISFSLWAKPRMLMKPRIIPVPHRLQMYPPATKEMADPGDTAEKVGMSALIVQVGSHTVK